MDLVLLLLFGFVYCGCGLLTGCKLLCADCGSCLWFVFRLRAGLWFGVGCLDPSWVWLLGCMIWGSGFVAGYLLIMVLVAGLSTAAVSLGWVSCF